MILPDDGGVRQVALPATAAELMMDAPGHFLADARAARVGARLAALSADEELELGAVYATFPMKRLGTPLAPADMARLAAVATREARRSAKVAAAVVAPPPTPLQAEDAAPRLRLDEMVDDEAVAADMNVYTPAEQRALTEADIGDHPRGELHVDKLKLYSLASSSPFFYFLFYVRYCFYYLF